MSDISRRDVLRRLALTLTATGLIDRVDLVIDHSVQVDAFGSGMAFQTNAEREFERNLERYERELADALTELRSTTSAPPRSTP